MLIGILAATGLGLAMLSGQQSGRREETLSMGRRQLEDKDKGVDANTEMLKELIKEQVEALDEMEIPSLWETFEIAVDNLYVIFIEDGSVTDVEDTKEAAIGMAKYRSEEEGTELVNVDYLRFVPPELRQRLQAYSDREGGFDDGYDAAGAIAQADAESPHMIREAIWSWNMYEDAPFESWGSEAQDQYREDLIDNLTEDHFLPTGTTLFHLTDEPELWEGTDDYPFNLWLFINPDDAVDHWREQVKTYRKGSAKRGRPRLLRFETTEQIYLVAINTDGKETLESSFELDLDDADEVEKNIRARDEMASGLLFNERGHYKMVFTDEAKEDVLTFLGEES